ncbi:cellulose 1,4-beta-cellobiosidase precursor [Tricladium varicosporioides]|nr:cellulose 1,4-beta-cellobiosidase precursor [Hymenoscyphus varicosporioides]
MASITKFGFVTSLLLTSALAQQPGAYTPEVHPKLTSQECTKAGGCVNVDTSVVLDANYRWLHNVGGYSPCNSGTFDKTYCPDVETCAKNCALEGVDYASYGIRTSGSSLTLNLFKREGNVTSMSSPRVYLMANETTYDMFKLLNQEISFDVDVSKVACGINGALYLSEMSADGNAGALNPAGAKYGTGYCDAQCPNQKFVNGVANLNSTYGACCNEMDLWEANNAATAYTPHPCNITSSYACTGALCGGGNNRYAGVCDQDGCDFNSYRNGAPDFYGPGKTVDTTKKFSVITQFLTNDNTATGTLKEIRRIYVQGGKVIQNSAVKVDGLKAGNSMDDEYCTAQKKVFPTTDAFKSQGGMKTMGEALGRGMVLVFSIWDDATGGMLWLDGTTGTGPGSVRGPCSATSGNSADIAKNYPDAAVTFENIKKGEIGSTFASS